MKKLVVLLIAALLMAGCGTPAPKGITVGATIYKFDDNFMSVVRQNMESYATEIGVTLKLVDSQNDQAKQNEQIDTMIADKVNVLAINLVDPAAGQAVVDKAKAAKLPIVLYNKEPKAEVMTSYDKVVYVGTNSVEAGVIQGKEIVDSWNANKDAWDKNKDGKIQYVLLKGEIGHPDAEARTAEAIKAVDGVGAEQLALESATWDGTKANEIMTTWLANFGDKIELVIANNDGMALGAIAALKAAGYFANDKFMPVYGVDAIAEALAAIEEGTMVSTVLNDAVNQAKATLDVAKNFADGKTAVEGTNWTLDAVNAIRVAYVGVNKDNYTQYK
jgi:methyl-galactoside transport system substrate-binding protein